MNYGAFQTIPPAMNPFLRKELETLIDAKFNGIQKKIEEIETTLESITKSEKENSSNFSSMDDEKACPYNDTLKIDSYLHCITGLALTCPIRFPYYLYLLFFKKGLTLKRRVYWFVCFIISIFFLSPGILTQLIQIYCGYYVYMEALDTFSTEDKSAYVTLKMIFLLIFVLMTYEEVTQGINSFYYCLFKAQNKKEFFISGCFLPPIAQISISFFIVFVSFLVIYSTDDPINIIQNFAGLYILLEVDNILMQFLRLSKLNVLFIKFTDELKEMRSELEIEEVFPDLFTKKLLCEETHETNFEERSEFYWKLVNFSRIIAFIALVSFSLLIWKYAVLGLKTNSIWDDDDS